MIKFVYSKTEFILPDRITSEQYDIFREKLKLDRDYNFGIPEETFASHFKSSLRFIIYSILYLLVFAFLIVQFYDGGNDDSLDFFRIIITLPAIFAGMGSLFLIFQLLAEAPSFSTYLIKKRKYFDLMRMSILNTDNYYDFCNVFYK